MNLVICVNLLCREDGNDDRERGGLDFYEKAIAIILSVSGNTTEVLGRIQNLKSYGTKVILISENSHNKAAQMADLCINYHLPNVKDKYYANSVTQVPVLYILECLANSL